MAERLREIRVALVLYGGVSLAVYENGVTRCFHDLVRGRGVFGLVLDMLEASATVDVISGTSAGGLNGLFLAAALESGSDFSAVAELWRKLGDMGALLCDVRDTGHTDALLKGAYFHEELIKAFQGFCSMKQADYRSPGEMDVFITGTDLDGQMRHYQDGLGREIQDKLHRTVFHLQHRPGRKSLGIRSPKNEVDVKSQAEILGTIGRITACFPVAFAPVKGTSLGEELRRRLDDSLLGVSEEVRPFSTGHSFVDGGVLDNKPFGPALRAIFFRMPGGIVDRRLFYVEPDPVPLAGGPKERRSPLEVGMACAGPIPSHESITEDLEKLLEHNQRIDWLSSVQEMLRKRHTEGDEEERRLPAAYMDARLECLARMMVLDVDSPPSALDYPRDAKRTALLAEVRRILKGDEEEREHRARAEYLEGLNRYDVVFHLRRAFHLLYSFHRELEAGVASSNHITAMRLTGRVIKVLKIILEAMLFLRDRFMGDYLKGAEANAAVAAKKLEGDFRAFLHADQPVWETLKPYFLHVDSLDLKRHAQEEHRFFAKEDLSRLVDSIWKGGGWGPVKGFSETTVLDRLAELLAAICRGVDGSARRMRALRAIDAQLYAAEFA